MINNNCSREKETGLMINCMYNNISPIHIYPNGNESLLDTLINSVKMLTSLQKRKRWPKLCMPNVG